MVLAVNLLKSSNEVGEPPKRYSQFNITHYKIRDFKFQMYILDTI